MHTEDAEDRIWSFHRDYTQALDVTGFGTLPKEKRHISIQHILDRVRPAKLKMRIDNITRWREDEHFDKVDFGRFLRELVNKPESYRERS